MKRLIFKIIIPILLITFWLYMSHSLSLVDGKISYFRLWVISGLPFGIKYMSGGFLSLLFDLQEGLIMLMINILIGAIFGGFALIGKIFDILHEIVLFILLDVLGKHIEVVYR